MPDLDALEAVGRAMMTQAPQGWRQLTLRTTAADAMTCATLVAVQRDSAIVPATLDTDGVLAVAELRRTMYRAGAGTWYNATITIGEDGQIVADFDYENAPFGGMVDGDDPEGDAEPELLIADHARYPRNRADLPPWHPARRVAT